MRSTGSVLVGALIAIAIACGGSQKQGVMAPPPGASTGGAAPPTGDPKRDEIGQLDDQIRAELLRMGLREPTPEMAPACADCTPRKMSDEIALRANDASCKPGTSETCRDSCKLADSICTSAGKICTIAADMGNDAWANGKCVDGKGSCDRAKSRCCSCQL